MNGSDPLPLRCHLRMPVVVISLTQLCWQAAGKKRADGHVLGPEAWRHRRRYHLGQLGSLQHRSICIAGGVGAQRRRG